MRALFEQTGGRLAGLPGELVSFRGRARIVDVLYLSVLLAMVGVVLRMSLNSLPWDAEWYAKAVIDVVLCVPFAALFVRRIHDQGLSGWWALLLLPFTPVNLYDSYRAVFAVRHHEWLFHSDPVDPWKFLLFPLALIVLVLFLRPGQGGPNRYGPDPREVRAPAPA